MTIAERFSSLLFIMLVAGCAAPPEEQTAAQRAAQTGEKGDEQQTDDGYDGAPSGGDDSFGDSFGDNAPADKSSGGGDSKSGSQGSGSLRICNQRTDQNLVRIVMAPEQDHGDSENVYDGNLGPRQCTNVRVPSRSASRFRVWYDYADHRRYTNSVSASFTGTVQAEPGPYSPDDEWTRWWD